MDEDAEYEIATTNRADEDAGCPASLRQAIISTLQRHATRRARLSIALVDDDTIARLNRRHLNRSGPTDVLAFDMKDRGRDGEPGAGDWDVDGEIVISLETAGRQARERGHDPEAELTLYAVHGTLHLLGFDDAEDGEARRMHALEDEILSGLGLGNVYQGRRP